MYLPHEEETLKRFRYLFDIRDPLVMISGGKDSTVMMELGAVVARERGVKLRVGHWDHEISEPDTVDYIDRISKRDDIDMNHFCFPHIVPTGFRDGEFIAWDPGKEWMRELPAGAITEQPVPEVGMVNIRNANEAISSKSSDGICLGFHADESPGRRMKKKNHGWQTNRSFFPVDHWSTRMVWEAIVRNGWDWSRWYLKMYRAGAQWNQRSPNLLGRESVQALNFARKAYPEWWERLLKRYPEADALVRLGLSGVIGRGTIDDSKVTLKMIADVVYCMSDPVRAEFKRAYRRFMNTALRGSGNFPKLGVIYKLALSGSLASERSTYNLAMNIHGEETGLWCVRGSRLKNKPPTKKKIRRIREYQKGLRQPSPQVKKLIR